MDLQQAIQPETPQDASKDYPQSDRAVQVLCVRESEDFGRGGPIGPGGRGRGACQRAADLFRVWPSGGGVRPAGETAIRVRAAVGDRRVFPVCDAAGGLSTMRGEGGASAVGGGKKLV